MSSDFKVFWIDHGREPKCPPNPAYPDGIDIDLSQGASMRCVCPLPHPTPRCGAFMVECKRCGADAFVTTAGRPDDPRSVTFACLHGGRDAKPS